MFSKRMFVAGARRAREQCRSNAEEAPKKLEESKQEPLPLAEVVKKEEAKPVKKEEEKKASEIEQEK